MSEVKLGKAKGLPKVEKNEELPVKKKGTKAEVKSAADIPFAKRRYDNYIGKYKINIEEASLIKEISSIGAFFLEYNEGLKSFVFFTAEGKRITLLSSYVLPNLPRDKRYKIEEVL